MIKMIIFRALVWGAVTFVVVFVLMCSLIVLSFDMNPLYELNRPYEDSLEIQRRALGKQYPCLKFVDGMIVHGKDTWTFAKYVIDKEEITQGFFL